MLQIDQIKTSYGEKTILHGVSLELAPGEVLALIGPNGSGKSTLIRSISGILPLKSGSIRINGKELNQLHDQERAKLVAVVPQARNLPSAFTAREVVALGRTPYLNWLGHLSVSDDEMIHSVMAQTDTLEFSDQLINELSGGEQQRILLARALVQQTPILLLDEPTAHLDLQFQVGLMKIVHLLAHPANPEQQPRAVLAALHDVNLAFEYADRVALLVKGRITHMGTPQEVLKPEILSKAYNVPLTLINDPKSGKSALLPQ